MMNQWQKYVTATEAGIIYCLEPVCTALYVLVVPAWLGKFAGVTYENETLTTALLVGGGLVTLANLLLQKK
jgi:drug/metabolite transporter (DMT)-like permease